MRMKNLFLSAAFFFCICCLLRAETIQTAENTIRPADYTPAVDSLLLLIGSSSGQDVLNLYTELHYELYEINNADVHLGYMRDYLSAAIAEENVYEEGFARVCIVEVMHNCNMNRKALIQEARTALDMLREHEDQRHFYFFVTWAILETHIVSGNYEAALHAAEEFYNEAKEMGYDSGVASTLQSMGRAYQTLDLFDKAEAAFRESIELAGDEFVDLTVKFQAYDSLIEMLVAQERNREALEACKEYEELLLRFDTHPRNSGGGGLNSYWFLNSISFAGIYRELGMFDMAEAYLAKASENSMASSDKGVLMLERARFELFYTQGEYAKAEKVLERVDEFMGMDADIQDKIVFIDYRAKLYHRWGKYAKAADAYSDYIAKNDSLQKLEMASRLDELRTQYEVDKLEMQREQDALKLKSSRNTITGLALIVIMAIIIIVIAIINTRRLRAKNRSLISRIDEQDKLEQENETLRERIAQTAAATESISAEENKETEDLYLNLKKLMSDPAVYTDPSIGRKTIAEQLGTNERYVYETIRNHYGMSVSNYITNLRLNYARKLLARSSAKDTVDSVASDAGFTGRSTFYRLFKERYGMTPQEFKHLADKR